MKVSVIVPIYNTQKYLIKCIDSIINQTEPDLEIILVDDGSTDDSGRICDAYAERDKRFRVIHKENGGVSSARNSGIDMMSGSYCCFVDSDDCISENYIAVLLNNQKVYCCDISVCGLSRTDAEEGSGSVTVLNRREAQLSLFNESGGIKGYIGGKLFKTDIIKKNNIKFDENQTLAEDLLFLFDYLKYCQSENAVCVSKNKLYCYENNSLGALTQRGRADVFQGKWCDAVNACEKILNKIPEEEKSLRRAVKLEKTMQCATMLRVMADYDEKTISKSYKEFILKNLIPYLFSKNFSARKKLGAIAVLVCPKNLLKRKERINKRTAIITFHRALNYGAILQAYALENILAKIGVYAEIIDYRCPHIECVYRPFDVRHCKDLLSKAKKCVKSFGLIKKRHNFNEFTKKHLNVTKKCGTKKDLQKAASEFETIITGSDQVFNPNAVGGDFSYFLDFVGSDTKKIAYAASIGYNSFPKEYESICIKHLKSFEGISVREKSVCQTLAELTDKAVENVLDPTLLLSASEWIDIAKKPHNLPNKYILVYMMEGCKYTIDKARALARGKGCKPVLINPTLKQVQTCKDFIMYKTASPEEFVGMFAEAEAVVTNSFHGVAFSLIFKKEFYAEASNAEKAARIIDLLELFDLSDRLLPNEKIGKPDWEKVSSQLLKEQDKSIYWLKNSLKLN